MLVTKQIHIEIVSFQMLLAYNKANGNLRGVKKVFVQMDFNLGHHRHQLFDLQLDKLPDRKVILAGPLHSMQIGPIVASNLLALIC